MNPRGSETAEILRAIAETGSFTRAGARLYVSQSAISRQILLLEEELNEPLFIRLGRQVQITPAGDALLQLSHRLFADIRDTCATIMDRQKVLTGTLTMVGGSRWQYGLDCPIHLQRQAPKPPGRAVRPTVTRSVSSRR